MIFYPRRGEERRGRGREGETRVVLFVCRQMASCLLKKSLEERTQKVVPQQALHSFQQFGSFIPLRTFVRMQLSELSYD